MAGEMGGEASLTSFCLPCTPGGQLSCSAPEGREAAEREGLRKLENHPGVRTLASWYFGTGHRKLKFGKEGLCLAHLFEAGLGAISEPPHIGVFFIVNLSWVSTFCRVEPIWFSH